MNRITTKEIQLSMYESMLRQRLLDEKVVELYKRTEPKAPDPTAMR